MTAIIDRRRAELLVLALLVLLAAAAPACLLLASPAAASPMDSSHGDCESPDGHVVVCPHQGQMQSSAVSNVDITPTLGSALHVAGALASPIVGDCLAVTALGRARAGPPTHLTPLRI